MAGKITASKYNEIKTWIGKNCNSPADDKKAMASLGDWILIVLGIIAGVIMFVFWIEILM